MKKILPTAKGTLSFENGLAIYRGYHAPKILSSEMMKAISEKLPQGTMVMAVDMTTLTDKEKERLNWLLLAQQLDYQSCIKCNYEWIPRDRSGYDCHKCKMSFPFDRARPGPKSVCPRCGQHGIPSWRKRHEENPAYSAGEGKFICKNCKEE